ncbi:hypothetical protein BBP40_003277 [Aspergillus hancockii]|nr:hypothetical protein BBP40_003277 [Aspergillus hancockii]
MLKDRRGLELQHLRLAGRHEVVDACRHPDMLDRGGLTGLDRGGTFCDVLVQVEGDEELVFKLLSEDPQNYRDAPIEAIRRALVIIENRDIRAEEKLDGSRIASCRIGFKDNCVIGDQSRPELFALKVRKTKALHSKVVEIDERVPVEVYDLNPSPLDKSAEITDANLVRTASGEIVRILKSTDLHEVRQTLADLKADGHTSVAVAFMHSYVYPDHERQVAALAKEMGFEYVTTSHETSPLIKFEQRSSSVCSEAYLFPSVKDYISAFESGFSTLPKKVEFMSSDGGLRQAAKFRGNEALLSGPAGGVVGIARTCFSSAEGMPVLGFDMGGTSTDVKIINPMLNMATVAAGGGSMLFACHGLFAVGPESAGAHPGPACYRKGGPLTVTDANRFLGRPVLSSFPATFGPAADQPLDDEVTRRKFEDIPHEVNQQTSQNLTPEEVALGFLNVANETMSRPIRNATEARGFAPSAHVLASFGGAGGQHARAIAEKLGIGQIVIHKHSSILSAVGITQAELQFETSIPFTGTFSMDILPDIEAQIRTLKETALKELKAQGADAGSIEYEESLSMRYVGADTNISISIPVDDDYGRKFIETHLREFAFVLSRKIAVDSIKVRGVGRSHTPDMTVSPYTEVKQLKALGQYIEPSVTQPVYVDSKWQNVPVYQLDNIGKPSKLRGPALVIDATQTLFVEPLFDAYILSDHVVLERSRDHGTESPEEHNAINPIQLSIFSHRFMSIAEQMGHTLQRTSISTSIKERLDFSCAIFSREGKLVAHAPNIPIHLGSVQDCVQYQHRLWAGRLKPGDVLLSNHPEAGGTHLPDLTVVTPCFIKEGDKQTLAFYVAARGHHTDIGGRGITAMMPESKELWEEGINVRSRKIVDSGTFLEDDIRQAFLDAGNLPGCSPTRRLQDNISDIKAQISSNQRGLNLLETLCEEFSFPVVHRYMHGIQANAEIVVREYLKGIARTREMPLTAIDSFDDGTVLKVSITIDEYGSAVFDWDGTGPQMWRNYNCPISITHSAVIYTMRCLVDTDTPLYDGCLAPITIKIPKGSVLHPSTNVAIYGSTLASQRVIDTILRAFNCVAAFSGCANSFGWGMGRKDPLTGAIEPGWNYGETVGGGCGAGPSWNGEHAIQAHSTNTKITDPEVVEKKTPVIIRQHAIRRGSGGTGKYRGGNGAIREIEARVPMKFSILSDRRVYHPYDMNGGGPGDVGRNYVFKWNENKTARNKLSIGGKAPLSLAAGEMMQINSPGGGGWGSIDS